MKAEDITVTNNWLISFQTDVSDGCENIKDKAAFEDKRKRLRALRPKFARTFFLPRNVQEISEHAFWPMDYGVL